MVRGCRLSSLRFHHFTTSYCPCLWPQKLWQNHLLSLPSQYSSPKVICLNVFPFLLWILFARLVFEANSWILWTGFLLKVLNLLHLCSKFWLFKLFVCCIVFLFSSWLEFDYFGLLGIVYKHQICLVFCCVLYWVCFVIKDQVFLEDNICLLTYTYSLNIGVNKACQELNFMFIGDWEL